MRESAVLLCRLSWLDFSQNQQKAGSSRSVGRRIKLLGTHNRSVFKFMECQPVFSPFNSFYLFSLLFFRAFFLSRSNRMNAGNGVLSWIDCVSLDFHWSVISTNRYTACTNHKIRFECFPHNKRIFIYWSYLEIKHEKKKRKIFFFFFTWFKQKSLGFVLERAFPHRKCCTNFTLTQKLQELFDNKMLMMIEQWARGIARRSL